jgi:hypothetical protein
LLPSIIVSGRSTSKEHAIHYCSTTHHIASVEWSSAVIETRLRNTSVCSEILGWNRETRDRSTVFLAIAVRVSAILVEKERKGGLQIATFDYQDADFGILSQSIGDYETTRPTASDDVVVISP